MLHGKLGRYGLHLEGRGLGSLFGAIRKHPRYEKKTVEEKKANFSRLNFAVYLEKRRLVERVLAPLPGITDLRCLWRSVARQAGSEWQMVVLRSLTLLKASCGYRS